MKRTQAFLIIFLCWGIIIALSSVWLVSAKRHPLLEFSRKVAEEEIIYYPLRAPIIDRNGQKICYTEWIFFVRTPLKHPKKITRLSNELGLDIISENDTLKCFIPKEKLSAAVKLCRLHRLRMSKHIVRRCIELPSAVKQKLGIVLLYRGLTGIEAGYNKHLQGTPGIYRAVRSPLPLRNIEKKSLRILSPMQPGRAVHLKQSVYELQCGIMPEVSEVR